MRRLTVALFALGASLAMIAGTATAKVLRVGTYHGVKGQYQSLQAAVDAAKPGDWILVGPGDYKTSRLRTPKAPAGVLSPTRNIHIRGMNRNTVIVDGTKPGSAVCSRKGSAQNLGLRGRAANNPYGGTAKVARSGANGLMVFKAANVTIQNLTACNFLSGSRDAGNEIWWNGGADSGKIGGHGYYGSYLTATNTYYAPNGTAAQYGIFSSNWTSGTWFETYASNFSDSGYYI